MNNGDAFEKVAGYEPEKTELRDVCKILKNADKLLSAGFRLPRGLLLAGAPGVGKSIMAECLIEESGIHCERISFDDYGENELTEYLDLKFKNAVKNAPSIIFMDELDKFLGEPGDFQVSYDMSATRKILKAINDNMSDGIMLLATVNDTDMLCDALKRSGRFDRILNIRMPSRKDREEIIRFYADDKPFETKIDFAAMAKITGGLSGADLECIINEAGLSAAVHERESIQQDDIDLAVDRFIFQGCKHEAAGEEKVREAVAVHEVGHLIAALILDFDGVGNVSILPQGDSDGHLKIGFDCDGLKTVKSLFDQAVIALAGQAAEEVFFPDKKLIGSASDIAKAQSIVVRLLTKECCAGYEYFMRSPEGPFSSEFVSERRLAKIEDKCTELMNACKEKAVKLITDNNDMAEKFIRKLVKNYALSREEIVRLYRIETTRIYKKKMKTQE